MGALLALPFYAVSIEYNPWFERILYPEGKVTGEYQGGKHADLIRNECGLRVTPWTDIRTEIELDFFKSRTYSYTLEAFKMAGQYRFRNQAIGDDFSLIAGGTFIVPSTQAKHEYDLFYPGSVEIEFHACIGREFEVCDTWYEREYLDVAFGMANERSPWWRFHYQLEKNFYEKGRLGLFATTLAGAGKKAFEYGGLYTYALDCGEIAVRVMKRSFARGLPRVTGVTIEFTTPLAF